MKNLLKLSLVFAVLLSTTTIRANEDIDFYLFSKKREGKQISLLINRIQEVNLSIYDLDGEKIFSEKATGELGIERTYSLEKFPKGNYILVIENDLKKISYQIVITDTNASISPKEIALFYKKIQTNKENLVSN